MKKRRTVLVCQGTGCISSLSNAVYDAFKNEVTRLAISDTKVDFTGCHGFCEQGPNVVIEPEGILYTHVLADDVPEIVQSHLRDGAVVERLFYREPTTGKHIPRYSDINFYKKQQRVILHNCGHINPEKISHYIKSGGFRALRKALLQMRPDMVIDEVKRAGLRGRGGAGFPTWRKWEFCRNAQGDQKYVICNADEGDPGAFMDRSILEADPYAVIEGLTIAGYAIGATEGYIYVRAEYPLAVSRIRYALTEVTKKGYLGNNILNSGFNFRVQVKEGAGAFVCGEETALIASIESRRGMPRPRPPFPAQAGLDGKPTIIIT
jgi:(2Fe-2S) ferredoxin